MTDGADIDDLAGEYVLGALAPEERRAVSARIASEPLLAHSVAEWERRLAPLGWRAPGIDANPNALGGILATIMRGGDNDARAAEIVVLRRRARTWRWLATGLAAALAMAAIGIGMVGPDVFGSGRGADVAVLASAPGSATADEPAGGVSVAFVATIDRTNDRMTIRQVAGRPAAGGRVFVAWLEPTAGAPPKLMGVLRRGDVLTHVDIAKVSADLRTSRLIVSLEQDRASGMDNPRGPIVSAGSFGRP